MKFTTEQVIEMSKAANILEPIELLPSNQWRDDTIRELTRLCTLAADRALEAAAQRGDAKAQAIRLYCNEAHVVELTNDIRAMKEQQ